MEKKVIFVGETTGEYSIIREYAQDKATVVIDNGEDLPEELNKWAEENNIDLHEFWVIYRLEISDEELEDLIEKGLMLLSQNIGEGADDCYFDYIPDLSEQICQLIYQLYDYDPDNKGSYIEQWAEMVGPEYVKELGCEEYTEYIEDIETLEQAKEDMWSKYYGQFFDAILTMSRIYDAVTNMY